MLCARIFGPLVSALWYSVCLLASLEFTISINRWDTPRNNASLLAGRCQSGH